MADSQSNPSADDAYLRAARWRPASVTTAAVIGLVFSSLGLLCNVVALVRTSVHRAAHGGVVSSAPRWMSAYGACEAIGGLIFAIVWFVTSIGLLNVARWSRSLAMKLAPCYIALLVLSLGLNLAVIAPKTIAIIQSDMALRPPPPTTRHAISPAGMKALTTWLTNGLAVFGFLFELILPATMLICLTRPAAKRAFAADYPMDSPTY